MSLIKLEELGSTEYATIDSRHPQQSCYLRSADHTKLANVILKSNAKIATSV
jgi:hypothetical protein